MESLSRREAKKGFRRANEEIITSLQYLWVRALVSLIVNTKAEVAEMGYFLGAVWYLFMIVQSFMAYGTAYRKTKANGDNGVSLVGWIIVYSFAAMIPGLGIHLWNKSREQE